MNDDVIELLLAGEHRRQHDTVVVDARLGPEHRHVIAVGGPGEELIEHAPSRHAVADNDKLLSGWSCCVRHLAPYSRTVTVGGLGMREPISRWRHDGGA